MHVRNAIAATLLSLMALTACATGSPDPAPSAPVTSEQPGPKPTVVLLHGAFEDPSSWDRVVDGLTADGYPVIAPAVPLRGVAADADAVRPTIEAVAGPKVLVGHSYAGLLISRLAAQVRDVRALVYVAAFIPQPGETAGGLNSQFPGSLIGPVTTHTVQGPGGQELYVNEQSFADIFAAGDASPQVRAAAAQQRPILAAAFDEKITTTAPRTIPAFAIVARNDKAIAPAAERAQAERAGATITEVDSPHAVAAADPATVVRVIRSAAG